MRVMRVEDAGHSGFFDDEAVYIRKVTDTFIRGNKRSKQTLCMARSKNLSKLKTRKRCKE